MFKLKLKRRDSNLVSSLMMFWKKLMHLMTGRHWPGSVSDCDVEQKLCTNCPSDAEISVTVSVATNKSFILFHKILTQDLHWCRFCLGHKKRIQLNSKLLTLVECDATKLMMTPTLNNKNHFFRLPISDRMFTKFDGRVDARKISVRRKTHLLKIKTQQFN